MSDLIDQSIAGENYVDCAAHACAAGAACPRRVPDCRTRCRCATAPWSAWPTASGTPRRIGAVMLVVPVTVLGRSMAGSTRKRRFIDVLANSVDMTGTVDGEARKSGIYMCRRFKAVCISPGRSRTTCCSMSWRPNRGSTKKIGHATCCSWPFRILAASAPSMGSASTAPRPVSAATAAGLQGVAAELGSLAPDHAATRHFCRGSRDFRHGAPAVSSLRTDPPACISPRLGPARVSAARFRRIGAPKVGPHGFAADWRVLQINRDYPQFWTEERVSEQQLAKSGFGVDFYQPVDAYQRDYRAIHYAVLFIALTFMALFLCENIRGCCRSCHAVRA